MPMKPVRRVARTLLATTFVAGGVNALMHPKPRAAAATALADQSRATLPDSLAARIPDDPGRLVKVNAVAQIAGGVLLASGRAPRPAALVLAATVVPGTVTEQDFWAEPDPDRRAAKLAGFLKDLGLLGGLLIAASDTAGKPSLGWRARQALSRRESRVAAESAALVGAAKVRGAHLAEVANEQGAQLAEIARDRGPQIAEAARERGVQLAEVAKERGPVLAEVAKERGAQLAEVAKDRGPVLAEAAKERGTQLAEVARERGPVLAEAARERGAHLLDVALTRGAHAADVVRERAERFEEAARERRAATH